MLKGKKVLLGITGSIAAYKSAYLVRLLVRAGAEVKVVMTDAAAGFIGPLTLSTLSRNEVLTRISSDDTWANHVMLGRWADVMVVAPLSCNTLAKMAHGICDNLLQAVYLSATCPVVVAPAMDEDMWKHPSTQNNLQLISSFGNNIISVNEGELASGLFGPGRMAEPEEIVEWLTTWFEKKNDFSGKTVLITAGPTYEKIDPVRFIGNRSSGKMGIAIASAFLERGARVQLILGPSSQPVPAGIRTIKVESAREMYEAALTAFEEADIAVLCAAVADYSIAAPASEKLKKENGAPQILLTPTRDILKSLGEKKSGNQLLVGFALETHNEEQNALKKLKDKRADLLVLNSLQEEGAGFGYNTNKITIFDRKGGVTRFEKRPKKEVANDILNTILKFSDA
ncbi:MAG: bifunctional phosphopantothenoylcysteine decarboxylase/phosphopantothenate--cysteine ligase CoaBC [Chitinophagaceae bacterium]|nr:bifunctional phosphopantothenoylcysteine decarboxylase/phosphopantothenate--cysteine ligase CoaBC [Bacteroidota bacterium]MCC6259120.1 bifunctional phosphopantothenoylcysteine decarboxylase/phosphopantothenate--cysteine ligase CoaBC [Chitinophagaceae bacterium]